MNSTKQMTSVQQNQVDVPDEKILTIIGGNHWHPAHRHRRSTWDRIPCLRGQYRPSISSHWTHYQSRSNSPRQYRLLRVVDVLHLDSSFCSVVAACSQTQHSSCSSYSNSHSQAQGPHSRQSLVGKTRNI